MLNLITLFVQQLTLDPQVHYCIPIAIPIIAAALATGAAANKYFSGKKQGKLADALGKTPRPFQTPEKEYFENVNTARNLVGMGLPGQEYLRNRLDRISSGAANKAIMAGQSPSSILSTISDVSGKQMDEEAALTYQGANYRTDAVKNLMGTKLQLAGEKKEAWDWNKKQPYLDAMAAASALRNASMLNKQSAFEDIAKVPLLFMGNKGMGGGRSAAPQAMSSIPPPTSVNSGQPLAVPDTLPNRVDTSGFTNENQQMNAYHYYKQTHPNSKLTYQEWKGLLASFNQ